MKIEQVVDGSTLFCFQFSSIFALVINSWCSAYVLRDIDSTVQGFLWYDVLDFFFLFITYSIVSLCFMSIMISIDLEFS